MALFGVRENKCFENISDLNDLKKQIADLSERVSKLENTIPIESGYLNDDGTVAWKLYKSGNLEITGTGSTKSYDNKTSISPLYNLKNVNDVSVASGVILVNSGAVAFANSEPTTLDVDCKTIAGEAFKGDYATSIQIGKNVTMIGANAFYGTGSKYHAGITQNAPTLYYAGTKAEWSKIKLTDGWAAGTYFDGNHVVCTDGTVAI